MTKPILSPDQIKSTVEDVLAKTQFIDIHTHLFAPEFGGLGLWGIDELLTYHYLEAEFFRSSDMTPEHYWKFSKQEQADAIWRALFVENSPVSEATRGVVAVLQAFDLPTQSSDLEEVRSFFRNQKVEAHVSRSRRERARVEELLHGLALLCVTHPVFLSNSRPARPLDGGANCCTHSRQSTMPCLRNLRCNEMR